MSGARRYRRKGTKKEQAARISRAIEAGALVTTSDPFHAMELRIMAAQRDQLRADYVAKIKAMTPAELEAEKRRTAELLARSRFRRRG